MTIKEIIKQSLAEDIGKGDHTSLATIPLIMPGNACLLVKENGIIAGIRIAKQVFKQVDDKLMFKQLIEDGSKIKFSDVAFLVEGSASSILTAERTALNFLQRMSGIATFTRKVMDKLSGLNTKILDTRKTTPLLRALEKEAVKLGGGTNHRMGLYDMIMIKDNHIDFAGGINEAVNLVHNYLNRNKLDLKIEIEVRNFDELDQVLKAGKIDRIMLDNFRPENLAKAIQLIDKKYETEASGGISLNNIREYAETGVDYISVGALTHQIKSLDMSLKAC